MKGIGGYHLVDVADVDGISRRGDPRGGERPLCVPIAQAITRDREGPVGQDHLDRHLVQPDLGVDVGADAHITAEEHERAGSECVTGAGGNDRDLASIQAVDERAAIGDQVDDRRRVVTEHHPEVEPGGESTWSTTDHERTDRFVGLCLTDRLVECGDDLERQRIRLAVVEVDDHDAVASLRGDCWRAHPHDATRRRDEP